MQPVVASLSSVTRTLVYALAACFGVLGLILFLAPGWSAANFAWNVSPFVAMTMGGWCLGNAYLAWTAARRWHWPQIHAVLIYLWAFGVLELGVLVAFRSVLRLESALAWLYVVTLGLAALSAVTGLYDWARQRLPLESGGAPYQPWVRGGVVFFEVVVAILAIGGSMAGRGGLATEGGIFPEPLTLFTVRAFAAFFAALVIGALPLVWAKGVEALLFYGQSGLVLIGPILIAAFVNIEKFDLVVRPLSSMYLVAYLGTFIYTSAVLWAYRQRFVPARQGADR